MYKKTLFTSLLLGSLLWAQDLSYQEIQNIAKESADDFLREYTGKDKASLIVSSFKNDTQIDDEIFTRSLLREIRKSGRYNLINSVNGDQMLYDARNLRDNEEYNPETTTEKGELVAPDISLSGRISKSIDGDEEVYLFLLTLTDIKTGIVIWDRDVIVKKNQEGSTTSFKNPTSLKTSTNINLPLQQSQSNIPQPKSSEKEVKDQRHSFFLLGVEGGAGKGKDSNLLYFVDVKMGYTYKWNHLFAFSLYGLYEFHNKSILKNQDDQDQEKNSQNNSHKRDKEWNEKDESESISNLSDEGYQQSIGAGLQLKLTYLYVGANLAKDFGNSALRYFFDAGLTFPIGFANLNLGARYTLSPSSNVKETYSGTVGIIFNL